MNIFGIGLQELFLIVLIALVVLGPTRMAGGARKAGSMLRDFRKMTDGIPKSLEDLEKYAEKSDQQSPKNQQTNAAPEHSQGWRPPGADQAGPSKPAGGA